jgi:hypothetical protein
MDLEVSCYLDLGVEGVGDPVGCWLQMGKGGGSLHLLP